MNLDKKDIENLIRSYPIGKLISFEGINTGFMNYSYILTTDKGKFVLRIGKKTKKQEDILFEINLLNSLENSPVPKYVRDLKRNYVNQSMGHNYAVYKYLDGNMPKRISNKVFKQLAYFLAKFHNQTKNFDLSQNRFAWYTFSDERANEFEKYLIKILNPYSPEIYYIKERLLENRLPKELPHGPIHCDVKRHNILAVKGKLTGVVDFDNCQIGPYLLDLAISINWFCTDKNGLDYRKTRKFVKYYEKFRKLGNLERKYLFQAIKYAYLSHEFVDYYVYAKGIISEGYFHFGRRFFLNAAIKMDKDKFSKCMNSPWF
ncbi:MAG: homoserine kinase [Candidatus Nanoarchaeia archaeon]|nr:homoserine kinase [Candidatus Nanoarchaeia archaeon]